MGIPSARITLAHHPYDVAAAEALHDCGIEILQALGADEVWSPYGFSESTILQGGTCRFGKDPQRSVLD